MQAVPAAIGFGDNQLIVRSHRVDAGLLQNGVQVLGRRDDGFVCAVAVGDSDHPGQTAHPQRHGGQHRPAAQQGGVFGQHPLRPAAQVFFGFGGKHRVPLSKKCRPKGRHKNFPL